MIDCTENEDGILTITWSENNPQELLKKRL
jgi:hypothetical protein